MAASYARQCCYSHMAAERDALRGETRGGACIHSLADVCCRGTRLVEPKAKNRPLLSFLMPVDELSRATDRFDFSRWAESGNRPPPSSCGHVHGLSRATDRPNSIVSGQRMANDRPNSFLCTYIDELLLGSFTEP